MRTDIPQPMIRTLVRGTYDVQKLRIQMGNRICTNFKAKLGQEPSRPESDLEQEEEDILDALRKSYKKLTDGVKTFPRQGTFKGDKLISDYTELCLVSQYIALEKDEDQHFRHLGHVLREYPIYTEFLEKVLGIGPAIAGVILSEINIHKAEYPSSLWMYAGLDVAQDGQGRSRKKQHLIDVEYLDKDKKTCLKKSITFNPFLKTKLIGVLGTSFIKQGTKSPYRLIYDNYKNRLQNMPAHKEKSKGHIHNMAVRYMVKRFLVDLYTAWRTLEGLPVAEEYSKAKLGIVHGKAA